RHSDWQHPGASSRCSTCSLDARHWSGSWAGQLSGNQGAAFGAPLCIRQLLFSTVLGRSLASNSNARRCSRLRRCFRESDAIRDRDPSSPPPHLLITPFERSLRLLQCGGHSLIGRRDRSAGTCLGNLLHEPSPFRFAENHLQVDADDVLDYGVVIIAPIALVPLWATSVCATGLPDSTQRSTRCCGVNTRFPLPASRAARPGKARTTLGRRA